MKIKVSALRRIIKEEISRCLIEQASDEKKAAIEKAEHLKAASDAASKQAAADDQEALELSDRAKKAQDDARGALKKRPGMSEYRKKTKGKPSDTGSEYRSGGRVNLRGGGISQRGLGRAFKKGGKV